MARNRKIERLELTARERRLSTAEEQADYRAMLNRDFGPPDYRPARVADDGRPVGLFALLTRPLGLLLLAITALAGTLTAKLWREGAFDPLWAPRGAVVETGSTRWTLGDRLPPPADDFVEPDVIDPIDASPAEPAEPAEEDDEAEAAVGVRLGPVD